MDTNQLIEQLKNPNFYPHPVKIPIEIIQTHASIIFLTGDYAYKIKKPVNYNFLDFSTLEKRKYYLEQELKLNKKVAANIYLEVLSINDDRGTISLNGTGKAIEYILKMNQFPQECLLSKIFERGELTENTIESLAKKVAQFHQQAETNSYITQFGDLAIIKHAFDENYQQTEKYINFVQTQKQYDETKGYTDKFFTEHGDWLEERQKKGMIRECHGDLHLNNICQWQGEVQLFDRIEFNESFRFVDVMYDIAFTAMDLTARNREDLANLFLNTYLEQTADWEGLKVLPIYLTRQAYVRAKVNSFLLDVDTFSETIKTTAQHYYQLAWQYTQPQKPRLILMSGFSGSGKSTIGKVIAKKLNGIQIRSDAVRKHLAGIDLNQTGNLDIYSLEMSQKTFAKLAELAEILIPLGYPVILDARYDKYAWREPLLTYAQSLRIPFHIVHCHAPIEILRQRIAARKGDISDATIEVLNAQIEKTEPFNEKEQPYLISLDTTNPDWQQFLESRLGK
jgi:aminoglycoside phosphotransferase family enzyme/predicted kinase